MPILDSIQSPEDLKLIPLSDLDQLCSEIRERIISVVSKNGGHLASNLGSIELLVAMHYIFNSPKDEFVFDVGHQTYTHKLLTGRNDARFDHLCKDQGLCGFTDPRESKHDLFYAGHAGTALSLALGLAKKRDLLKGSHHILPVIGDATLTCGLALEALNNCSRDLKKFIVILNDNEMSISKNVGSITNILSRLLNNPTTNKWVHELEKITSRIPRCGSALAKQGFKITESIKNLVSSASFFEHFGFSYIGPIDGHDLKQMISVFHAIQNFEMPLIVHLYTKKGQGIDKAVKDPIKYHGVKPFDPKTYDFLPTQSKTSFPKVFGSQLLKLAQEDEKIVAVTPAMALGSCLDPFLDHFPNRCFDVGIAEGHAVTFSAGLAKNHQLKVFCVIYATFLQRALDNVFHDVCLQNLPVIFALDRAGLAGYGPTHHSIYDLSFLQTMPNLIIAQPRNGDVLNDLMQSALQFESPTVIRYPNLPTNYDNRPFQKRIPGQGELLASGNDLLIIPLGDRVESAFEVKQHLEKEEITVSIFDPIFIQPLDERLLEFAKRCPNIVVIEEHSKTGGLASALLEFFMAHKIDVNLLSFGIPKMFVEHGSRQKMLESCGLDTDYLISEIKQHFLFNPAVTP